MKISMKYALVIGFVAVILINLMFQLSFNLFFAKEYYTDYHAEKMQSLFSDIKIYYNDTTEQIASVVMEYEAKYNMEVIIQKDETLVYASFDKYFPTLSDVMPNPQPLPPMITENNFLYAQNPFPHIMNENSQHNPNKKTKTLTLLGKFDYKTSEVLVFISSPLESIENSAEVFTHSHMMISSVVLVVSVFIALLLSKIITAPIGHMEQVAWNMSKLEFHEQAKTDVSVIEIASLAKSINSMSSLLSHSITELNQVNSALQKDIDYQKDVENMRKEFIANVSHEMKTPLALLQLYADGLRHGGAEIDTEFYLDTILEETQHLNEMVMSMLDISSIESGLSKMNFYEIDLSILCMNLIQKMNPLLSEYEYIVEIEEDIDCICDGKYVEQAMKNYIMNGIEHTQPTKKIKIILQKNQNNVLFSVYNEGKEISEKHLQAIWTSFYRVDKARTHNQKNQKKNIGMGLHIVKTIVEKHQGQCKVLNQKQGVKFSFLLPLTQETHESVENKTK